MPVGPLLDYLVEHFTFEENLLRRCDYPGLEAHIAEHSQLIVDVRRQWGRIDQGEPNIARGVVATIERWIVEHINAGDVGYAQVIQTD